MTGVFEGQFWVLKELYKKCLRGCVCVQFPQVSENPTAAGVLSEKHSVLDLDDVISTDPRTSAEYQHIPSTQL